MKIIRISDDLHAALVRIGKVEQRRVSKQAEVMLRIAVEQYQWQHAKSGEVKKPGQNTPNSAS